MEGYISKINIYLRWIFTELFYPAIIIGVFLLMLFLIASVIIQGEGNGRIRRVTGALLPLIFLVFALMWVGQGDEPIGSFLFSLSVLYHYLLGIIVGVLLLEIGIRLQKTDLEVGPSLYALFLSSVCVFILYSVMQGILGRLNHFLFALIGSAGFHIIFRGPPIPEKTGERFKNKNDATQFKEDLFLVKKQVEQLRKETDGLKAYGQKLMDEFERLKTRMEISLMEIEQFTRGSRVYEAKPSKAPSEPKVPKS